MAQADRRRGERDPGRERFWRETLARFRASGLSVRGFCRRENLGEPLFYAWRRTIGERDAETKTARTRPGRRRRARLRRTRPIGAGTPPAFLPVVTAQEPPGMALELRGGRVLRFVDSTPAERVAELVRALEAMEGAS